MNEQELTEARTLIVEVRAMLKAGTQAVQDLRDLRVRFENQATPVPAPTSGVDDSRLSALEAQVRALGQRRDEMGAAEAQRFAALETEVRRTVQALELRATSALTALNLRAGGPS